MTISPLTDAVGFVRGHPEIFFAGATPSAGACAQQLVGEVLALGATDVTVERVGDWWIVSSSLDWFLPDQSAEEQVRRLVPLPQAGVNCSRVEVVLVAFAEAVATLTAGQEWRSLSGPAPTGDLGGRRAGRAVAFRFGGS